MEPKRFRELQRAAEEGAAVALKKEELAELLDNTISLMGEYASREKERVAAKKASEEGQERFRFRRQIFMGSHIMTAVSIGHAYTLLSEAFNILGGIQQPPSIHEKPSAEDEEERHSGACRVKCIAQELYIGLTGQKVVKVADVEEE